MATVQVHAHMGRFGIDAGKEEEIAIIQPSCPGAIADPYRPP